MSGLLKIFLKPFLVLTAIVIIGTLGYAILDEDGHPVVDCLYMTLITITTIGYTEVIDMEGNSLARIFTVMIALSGIGLLGYIVSSLTAFVVEGKISKSLEKKRMEKLLKKLKGHYIVCGIGRVGRHIVKELDLTGRSYVIVDNTLERIEEFQKEYPSILFVAGDATDDKTLLMAGIEHAEGIFAATEDDNRNLVISLSAKHLNASIRVISNCGEVNHLEKIRKAGADSVISPTFIGGLRMVSEMIRPTVVSFLDTMLRDKDKKLRVEEVPLNEHFTGKRVEDLNLDHYEHSLLLAIKNTADWIFNPRKNHMLQDGDVLIVMTTPDERQALLSKLRS